MNPMNLVKRKPSAVPAAGEDAVARLHEQVRTAKGMAATPDRELLEDPATNPAVHGHREQLRDGAHRRQLDMDHARTLRSLRVHDARAHRAERELEAVAAAREADAPAAAVLDLTRHRSRMAAGAIGASLLLSVGSAMGIEALATSWGAPTGVGYLAEVGLTVLSTAAIVLRGWQVRHGATLTTSQKRAMAALMFLPLLGSIVGSTAGSGPVGAACSIGAASFAGLAYLVSTTLSTAIRHQVARLDAQADEEALAATATGEQTAATPVDPTPDERAPERATVADEAAEYLRTTPPSTEEGDQEDGDDTNTTPMVLRPRRPDLWWGAHRDAQQAPTPEEGVPAEGAHSEEYDDAEEPEDGGSEDPMAPTPAAVRAYRDTHPDASISQIARAFAVSRRSVRRYLATADADEEKGDAS